MQTQLPKSAYQAQAILGAWTSGDVGRFCHELDHVSRCAAEPAEVEERERIELLCAIAEDLRIPSIQPLPNDPNNIYCSLLRHLAFSRRPLRQRQEPSKRKLSKGPLKQPPVIQ
jgi:hypothetical protein